MLKLKNFARGQKVTSNLNVESDPSLNSGLTVGQSTSTPQTGGVGEFNPHKINLSDDVVKGSADGTGQNNIISNSTSPSSINIQDERKLDALSPNSLYLDVKDSGNEDVFTTAENSIHVKFDDAVSKDEDKIEDSKITEPPTSSIQK